MAKLSIEYVSLTAIGNAIREKTKDTELIPLEDMPEKVGEVYEMGKQSAYDEFWDAAQQNGLRTNYDYFFAGSAFTKETAKAKYPIKPASAYGMFERSKNSVRPITSFDDIGVEIDFSNCTSMINTFVNSNIKVIPRLTSKSGSNCNFSSCCQYAAELETIGEFKVTSTSIGNTSGMFTGCTKLKNITMVGTLALTISFSACPLTKASIESIINCLSSTVTGKTLTLKKSAVNTAFGIDVDDEATYPEGSEFYVLRHSKDNWTISYA